MAESTRFDIRKRVIDRCLSSDRGYSTHEIMEKCNEELECQGRGKVNSLNTIRDDIMHIANNNFVEIETICDGRFKRYRYKDRNFSVYSAPLSEHDISNLKDITSNLNVYQGRPQFEFLKETIARIESVMSCHIKEQKPVVSFQDNPDLKGLDYFQPLLSAIKEKQTLKLTYQSFKNKEQDERIISPYYLKQYNNRWFLMASTKGFDNISQYALDRIISLDNTTEPYEENTRYDFETYFYDIVGVSRPKDRNVETICFKVSGSLKPYIETKPIHNTQTIIEDNNEYAVFQIKVIPNFELEQLLLSFGEGLEVLYPADFREKIAGRIKENAKKYDRFNSTEPIFSSFAPKINV